MRTSRKHSSTLDLKAIKWEFAQIQSLNLNDLPQSKIIACRLARLLFMMSWTKFAGTAVALIKFPLAFFRVLRLAKYSLPASSLIPCPEKNSKTRSSHDCQTTSQFQAALCGVEDWQAFLPDQIHPFLDLATLSAELQCPLLCELSFKYGDIWEVDHVVPTSRGGKNIQSNLQLLHRHCHDSKRTQRQSKTTTVASVDEASRITVAILPVSMSINTGMGIRQDRHP